MWLTVLFTFFFADVRFRALVLACRTWDETKSQNTVLAPRKENTIQKQKSQREKLVASKPVENAVAQPQLRSTFVDLPRAPHTSAAPLTRP
jgi:hypothetical protein